MNNFSEKIKKFREENNLTQQDFADKVHVSRQAVSKWENGNSYPNYEILKDIADILNTTVDELLSKEEIDKETINVKHKNKRNLILIISIAFIAILSIIIGIISLTNSTKKVQDEVIEEKEEITKKYLGVILKSDDFYDIKDPTVEDFNNDIYPGIYLERTGNMFALINNRSSSRHSYETIYDNKTLYENEFTFKNNGNLLSTYYVYLDLNTNEILFERTEQMAIRLQTPLSEHSFKISNIFDDYEYEYKLTIKTAKSSSQTKIIEYDDQFKKIKETIIDYDNIINTYIVSKECLYVIVEDYFEESSDKRIVWKEDMPKIILLYYTNDSIYSNVIAINK